MSDETFADALALKERETIAKCITYLMKRGYPLADIREGDNKLPEKLKEVIKPFPEFVHIDKHDKKSLVDLIKKNISDLPETSVAEVLWEINDLEDIMARNGFDFDSFAISADYQTTENLLATLKKREDSFCKLVTFLEKNKLADDSGLEGLVDILEAGSQAGRRNSSNALDDFMRTIACINLEFGNLSHLYFENKNSKSEYADVI